jgi:hypothetical protein
MTLTRHVHHRAERRRAVFWAWRGIALLVLAALLQAASPVLFGVRGARIYVRWTENVDDAARARFERELDLTDPRVHEGTTWTYAIADVSTAHLRAIVGHPAVADTHKVNRTTFRLFPDTERTARQGGLIRDGDRHVPFLEALVTALALLAVLPLGLALVHVRRWPDSIAARVHRVDEVAAHPFRAFAAAARPLGSALQRGIPVIDARAAGIFRVVFGALLLAFLFLQPVDASWLPSRDAVQVTGGLHGILLDVLVPRPWVVDRIWVATLVLGAMFTIGLFTRWTFAAFVAGFLLWVTVYVAHRGSHTSTAIALALVALLPSRWGDGFSIDGYLRDRGVSAPGVRYGYAVWVPVLVLGLCFAAAAWCKLKDGSEWVTNGSVAFHFITDAPQALVPWGLWIARSQALSVAFSLMAVVTEAFIITAAFTRSRRYRAIAGVGAVALLSGFALLQGVIWPTWWILLLGFLPWERFAASNQQAVTSGSYTASFPQMAMAVLVIAQQLVASGTRAEAAPLFSAYDMYSATYSSRDAFDRTRPVVYRLIDVTGDDKRELPCRVEEEFAAEFQKLAAGDSADHRMLVDGLRSCAVPLEPPRQLALVGNRVRFDWDRGEVKSEPAPTVGPISSASIEPDRETGAPDRR